MRQSSPFRVIRYHLYVEFIGIVGLVVVLVPAVNEYAPRRVEFQPTVARFPRTLPPFDPALEQFVKG